MGNILKLFSGFLRVEFSGEMPERIFNLSIKNRICLWDSKKNEDAIECSLSVGDFKRLRPIIRGSKIKMHILEKHGIRFKIHKNRRRFGLVIGLIWLLVFLKLMSGYVWIIDIEGNQNLSDGEIISVLETIGIKEGMKASKIDSKIDRERLLLKTEELAWASLNVEGSKLTVNVSEVKSRKPENTACNLISNADGIIKKIDVTSGNCLVKIGDTVKKGDVLVSGIKETGSGTEFIVSQGEIIADIKREISLSEKRNQTVKSFISKTKNKAVLEVFTFKIPLYLTCETEKYESETKLKQAKLFAKNLPFKLYIKSFDFFTEEKIKYTDEQLNLKIENRLKNELKKEKIEDFSLSDKVISLTEEKITLKAIISTEQNIAKKQELNINPTN